MVDVFLQVGATRDGLDPYRLVAHARGLQAWLVETPDYLWYRAGLPGRERFDREIPVASAADADQVAAALAGLGLRPLLVLPGFDRYTATAHELDSRFCERRAAPPFDKASQRLTMARAFPDQPQPAFNAVSDWSRLPDVCTWLSGAVVVKVVDGAAGLGVYRVATRHEARAVASRLGQLRNYDGTPFAGALVEQHVAGTEYSLQGIARDGRADLLSMCEKVVGVEADPDAPQLRGFRELAHIAQRDAPLRRTSPCSRSAA
jgi:hypothetical protein